MKITTEMIHTAYNVAKNIYEGHLSSTEGKNKLVEATKMNPRSASIYIYNVNHLHDLKRQNKTRDY
jgi:hypothetical protein